MNDNGITKQPPSGKMRKIFLQRVLPILAAISGLFLLIAFGFFRSVSRENGYNYTFQQKLMMSVIMGAVLTVAISFGISILVVLFLALRKKPFESNAHGSARAATDDELINEGFLRSPNNFAPLKEGEFYLGIRSVPNAPRNGEGVVTVVPAHRAARHGMNVGATGTGKTVNLVIPNIVYANERAESLFLTDVKGELWARTSGLRSYPIYVSPLEPEKNMVRFNWIPAMRENPVLAEKFAQAVVFNRSENKDSHWTQSAIELLQAVWLHTAVTETPSPLLAYEILFAPVQQLRHILENSPSSFAREAARQYLDAPEKEAGSILSTTRAAYKWLRIPQLKEFCNSDKATNFMQLRTGIDGIAPTIYYQAREDEVELLKPLNALFFTYMLWQLKNIEGNTIKFLMDEFANFGKIPNFENEITLLRSRKMPVFIFLQSLRSQLESIYGKIATDTILGNLHVKSAFNGLEYGDAEAISKALGDLTNVSEVPTHDGKTNLQLNARRLMTADEVSRMSKELIIVFQCGELHPFLVKRQPITIQEASVSEVSLFAASTETYKPLPKFDLSGSLPALEEKPKKKLPPMPKMPEKDWEDIVFPGDEEKH